MSRQSNSYVILFSVIMTLIVGGLLAGVSSALKGRQNEQIALDKQKQILKSVMSIDGVEDIQALYASRISAYVVDINGNKVDAGVPAEDVDISKEFKNKKDPADRFYPVFEFKGESGATEAYILPVFGNGLWDNIWGFVALDTDFNTIKGVSLDHAGETPGLGARITTPKVQDRFQGKKIYSASGELVAVTMLKGESNPANLLDDHHVNGMSGATITGNGVTAMFQSYMAHYQGFFKQQSGQAATLIQE
ncbi:MAG: NADH:ubiquinone reductase (Na(+)-transporting) subunit C [Bacteroidota bacterium]